MIKCFLTYILLLFNVVYAQVEIKNFSLIDPDINILYLGIDNKIVITGIKDTTNLMLTSATGKVLQFRSYKSNEFIVKAEYTKTDTLRFYQAEKLILTKIYEVKQIGYPIARLGIVKDTIATVDQILSDPTISAVIPKSYYDHHIMIISFECYLVQNYDTIRLSKVIQPGTADTIYSVNPYPPYEILLLVATYKDLEYIYETSGNMLQPHQINEIRKMKSGDTLIIDRIQAIVPAGSTRTLDPIKITIK